METKFNAMINVAEDVSTDGRSINNIFDTLYCRKGEKGKFHILIDMCVIGVNQEPRELEPYEYSAEVKYYIKEEKRFKRVDLIKGIIPSEEEKTTQGANEIQPVSIVTRHININTTLQLLGTGEYEVVLYARKKDGVHNEDMRANPENLQAYTAFDVAYTEE